MTRASKRLPKPGEFIFKIAGKNEAGPGSISYYMVYRTHGKEVQVWSVGAGNPGPFEPWADWLASGWRVGHVPKDEPRLSYSYMEAKGIAHGRKMERAHIVSRFRAQADRVLRSSDKAAARRVFNDLMELASMLERGDPKFQ